MRIRLVLLIMFLLTGSAFGFSDADRSAVRSVIERQIGAFLSDDAATAYSFAAPGIKAMFPSEQIFMQMVEKAYPQVYRPQSYSFSELRQTAAGLEQLVDIVDAKGELWTARYSLMQMPDGSWKITGCTLVKRPGEVA